MTQTPKQVSTGIPGYSSVVRTTLKFGHSMHRKGTSFLGSQEILSLFPAERSGEDGLIAEKRERSPLCPDLYR